MWPSVSVRWALARRAAPFQLASAGPQDMPSGEIGIAPRTPADPELQGSWARYHTGGWTLAARPGSPQPLALKGGWTGPAQVAHVPGNLTVMV